MTVRLRWVCDSCLELVPEAQPVDGRELMRCCVCGRDGEHRQVSLVHSERAHYLLADKLKAERLAKGTVSAPEHDEVTP